MYSLSNISSWYANREYMVFRWQKLSGSNSVSKLICLQWNSSRAEFSKAFLSLVMRVDSHFFLFPLNHFIKIYAGFPSEWKFHKWAQVCERAGCFPLQPQLILVCNQKLGREADFVFYSNGRERYNWKERLSVVSLTERRHRRGCRRCCFNQNEE